MERHAAVRQWPPHAEGDRDSLGNAPGLGSDDQSSILVARLSGVRSADAEHDRFSARAQCGERWLPEGFGGFRLDGDCGFGKDNHGRVGREGARLKPLGRLEIGKGSVSV